MKKFSHLLLPFTLILVLLTAACGAEGGTTAPTTVGTILPEGSDLTGTPVVTATAGADTTATLEAATAIGTATGIPGLETPTAGTAVGGAGLATQGVPTQATRASTTQTAVVAVTGEDVILVECQFCVDTRAHALLVLPDTATFQIVSPPPTTSPSTTTTAPDAEPRCTSVEVNNGRQVVLCSGPEMTPLVVNICTGANTCTDFPVDLLACPLTQGGAATPGHPNATPNATTDTTAATVTPPLTNTPGVIVSTPTP